MSLSELLPAVHSLPRSDKYLLLQELVADLARDEGLAEGDYPIWSPYDSHEAAVTLTRMLEEERAKAA
jgi:hypothetical protein